jgi:hypothetical protein
VPLADFAPTVDPAGLRAIRFTFGGDEAGAVYLDDVAFSRW